jgi:hypothetical protein
MRDEKIAFFMHMSVGPVLYSLCCIISVHRLSDSYRYPKVSGSVLISTIMKVDWIALSR